MIDIPTISGNISLLEGAMAIALFVAGLFIHEALHTVPLRLTGVPYEMEWLPFHAEDGLADALVRGPIAKLTMQERPPTWIVAASTLAPVFQALFPITMLFVAFQYPVVDWGTLFIAFMWLSVAIPSAGDWVELFRYSQFNSQTEVVNNG